MSGPFKVGGVEPLQPKPEEEGGQRAGQGHSHHYLGPCGRRATSAGMGWPGEKTRKWGEGVCGLENMAAGCHRGRGRPSPGTCSRCQRPRQAEERWARGCGGLRTPRRPGEGRQLCGLTANTGLLVRHVGNLPQRDRCFHGTCLTSSRRSQIT